jgi:peptide/nickel transport system permease protein
MVIFVMRRFVTSVLLIAGIFVIVFFALRAASGGPARPGRDSTPREEVLERYRRDFGTEMPPFWQLVDFLSGLPRGDFGTSSRYQQPVLAVIGSVAPHTLRLGGISLLVVILLSVGLGVLSAVKRGSWLDRAVLAVIVFGQSVPAFWLGLMLALVFAVRLGVFPAVGYAGPQSLVLPALTIVLTELPWHASVIRSEMIEALLQDYVRTERAYGIRRSRIHFLYALRNAAIPWLSVLGVRAGTLFAGTLVAEVVFNYPGLGKLFMDAVSSRDYELVQSISVLAAAVFVFLSFLVDVAYARIDPRIRAR